MPLRNSNLAAIPGVWNGRKELRKKGTKSHGSTCEEARPDHISLRRLSLQKPATELFLGPISKFFTQSGICSTVLMN